ncbi:uncharacterized protein B0I36DRAFT_431388 [Microdochium trichocladiopsis]|uniref:Uncharacterized protein n=1 Tax=Microdochium trichocladiopsis TaxID=1682393 RepID=A0A9P8Y9N5_9PEZI|nr:uncharacterized protein B0I36DRAFT_431388 [Microdochium trichocladiopsis]KAH7031245.1 hypothetical protein B0I36DRAFT_431388 [Microdochium trichocladiopsis]
MSGNRAVLATSRRIGHDSQAWWRVRRVWLETARPAGAGAVGGRGVWRLASSSTTRPPSPAHTPPPCHLQAPGSHPSPSSLVPGPWYRYSTYSPGFLQASWSASQVSPPLFSFLAPLLHAWGPGRPPPTWAPSLNHAPARLDHAPARLDHAPLVSELGPENGNRAARGTALCATVLLLRLHRALEAAIEVYPRRDRRALSRQAGERSATHEPPRDSGATSTIARPHVTSTAVRLWATQDVPAGWVPVGYSRHEIMKIHRHGRRKSWWMASETVKGSAIPLLVVVQITRTLMDFGQEIEGRKSLISSLTVHCSSWGVENRV